MTRQSSRSPEATSRRSKTAPVEEPKRIARTKVQADEPVSRRSKTKVEDAPTRRTRSPKAEEEPLEKKARRSKSTEVVVRDEDTEEAPKKTRKTRKTEVEDDDGEVVCGFDPYSKMDEMLDGIEKDYSLSGSGLSKDEKRLSTGFLVTDLILGGGIVGGGWYTLFGMEQSCKSTAASTWMAAAVATDVPIISVWDYEGSTSPDYLENIMRTNGINATVEDVFGIRDPKTQQWVVKPRVRYYSESVGEKFFDYLAKLERTLPDKKQVGDNWYYVYEDSKQARAVVGSHYDENYLKKTGKLRVPAKDGNIQALVIVDSYPAMLPEKQDVDDPNNAIGVQARMFSDQLKRVKGKMRAKRIAVIGVNQLREKPMAMFQDPNYEPCGNSLKFFSDVRLQLTPRALSSIVPGAKGRVEEEDSVTTEGKDNYRYIAVKAAKNKLSPPHLEGWLRLWISDGDGAAQGFDPVWDTFQYLLMTGQMTGSRNKIKLNLKRKGGQATKAVSWLEFKTLVIGAKVDMKKIFEQIGVAPLPLRKFCFQQMDKGEGIELFFDAKRVTKGVKKEEDSEEE